MTETPTPFATIEEVAKYFVVRTWLRNGTIPKHTYLKVGNTYRFNLPDVAAALVNAPKEPVQLELDLGNDN
jgi:hypothetical protein